MGRFGAGDDPFGASELNRLCEGLGLMKRFCLDDSLFGEQRDQRGHPVISETSSMNRIRNEVMAERVHLEQWSHPDGVPKVVLVATSGDRRGGSRLDRPDDRVHLPGKLLTDEREAET